MDPRPEDEIVPVMELFKCKIDKEGMIDKLKARIVFRGDLYDPKDPQDSWNPHALFLALKVFLATCARLGMFPSQTDFILAYLQADMRERVFVKFPDYWVKFLPEHLHKWIGRPLLLKKALYGYNYSGKFLYLDQAEFLESQGFEKSGLPGLWVKHLDDGHVMLFLHYSDDIMSASTNDEAHQEFLAALGERFDVETKPRADWYLQTRIQQDKDGNIMLDQEKYAKSVLQRFLPNVANTEPTQVERKRYSAPMKSGVVLSKQQCSFSKGEVEELKSEYGFRFIEVAGAMNWLACTCCKEICAIQKLCRFRRKPGQRTLPSRPAFTAPP